MKVTGKKVKKGVPAKTRGAARQEKLVVKLGRWYEDGYKDIQGPIIRNNGFYKTSHPYVAKGSYRSYSKNGSFGFIVGSMYDLQREVPPPKGRAAK